MRRAGLPFGAIAQEKKGCAAFNRAQAQPPADGEVESLGCPTDVRHDAGDRPAGQRFFGHPEQVLHIGGAYEDQLGRVEAEAGQPRSIRQAEELRILIQLQIEHGQAPWGQQGLGLAQRKGQTRPAIADSIGKNLLQQATGQARKALPIGSERTRLHPGQRRFALNIGNDIPQRGKALLAALSLHGANGLYEQNKNI